MSHKRLFFSRLILFFLTSLGLYLQLTRHGLGMLTYYTILSNLLVFVFTACLVYLTFRGRETLLTSSAFVRVKAGVTMAIMITFAVYHLLLAPIAKDFWRLENILCHYIVPLYFFLDTLLVDRAKLYRRLDPFFWALPPLAYCGFALLNGFVFKIPVPDTKDSPFPYFFVNVPKHGWPYVGRMIIMICTAYILGGYLLYLIKSADLRRIGLSGRKPE